MYDRMNTAGDLPWGWWLRASSRGLEDAEGRSWSSVRQAWWEGELRFPRVHFMQEQHELLLRVLNAIDPQKAGTGERCRDLFDGDMMAWRFYMSWLVSIGMLDMSPRGGFTTDPLSAPLSAEGRSVLLMLRATRDPEWVDLPMPEVVAAVAAASRGPADEARERALRVFETGLGLRRNIFARERVGGSHLVTLTGIGAGQGARMPIRRVHWSQSFPDAVTRDDLFGWLAMRVDRWDDWSALAYGKGSDALTRHLFALFICGSARPS